MAIPTTEAEIAAVFADNATFSLGCMFAQVVVDTYFAGIMTMQVYQYFKYQRNDRWWTKGVVIAAATINLCITVYIWYFIQYLFVTNFGKWSPFAETKRLAWFPFLDSLNSAVCQSFFTYRAWRLCGRQWIIPVVLGALILMSIGATLAVLIMFSSFDSLFQAAGVSVPELIWLSSIMAADIIITMCILYGLLRSKTGWTHTDRVISRLIRMTLESQVPPTIIATIFVIEFVKSPSSLFGSTLQGIQSKFYGMGLMYALNARLHFQSNASGDEDQNGPEFAMSNRPTQRTIQVDVEVNQQTYVQSVPETRTVGLNRAPYVDMDDDKNSLSDGLGEIIVVNNKSQSRLPGPDPKSYF